MEVLEKVRELSYAALDLFYPPQCAYCRAIIPREKQICAACFDSAQRITAPFCKVCSQPFDGAIEGEFECPNCHDLQFDFDCVVAACRSRGIVREFIHRFKYHREYRLRYPLSDWLKETLYDERLKGRAFDAFVPIPLHSARKREREFNQAEVLGKILSESQGIPLINALSRIRYTETQTHFDRKERMENLRNAFILGKDRCVKNLNLLLIDDVLTTGSTVQECARTLREAGARSVCVIVVGRA